MAKHQKETAVRLGGFYVSEKEDLGGIAVPDSPTKVYEVYATKPGRVSYRDEIWRLLELHSQVFELAVREVPKPVGWFANRSAQSILEDVIDFVDAKRGGYRTIIDEDREK